MKHIALLVTLLTMPITNADGMKPSEYFGDWTATYSPTRGESNTLQISETLGAKFVRDFGSAPESQELMAPTDSLRFVDDILIIDFRDNPVETTYKLVLSGFETPQHEPVLEGTVFMYLDGAMVNGMHIAFRKSGQ